LRNLYSITQVMAVDMSYRLGWIDESLVKRVGDILKQSKLPTAPPEIMTVDMFKSVMAVRADGWYPFNVLFVLIIELIVNFFSYIRLTRR